MKKEQCAECQKLRKRFHDAEEREALLNKGLDYLVREIRKLKRERVQRNLRERKA